MGERLTKAQEFEIYCDPRVRAFAALFSRWVVSFFLIFFKPLFREDEPHFDEHIFADGLGNHQTVLLCFDFIEDYGSIEGL